MESKHSLLKSFQFAFDGLRVAIKKGRNFRIQILLGLIASLLGFFVGLSGAEWLDLVIVIFLILILELINTSLEALIDLVSPEIKEKAKIAKDVAAAAVLLASIASILMAAIIFIPKLI